MLAGPKPGQTMARDYLSLRFSQELLVDDEEPSRFVKDISGTVFAAVDDDADGYKDVEAGKFAVFVIDLEAAVNEKESAFDIFDVSSKTIGYFDLYTDDLAFKPEVLKAMRGHERWAPNILILDRLELLPEWRRRGLGLRTLRWLQFHFSTGCGIVAMKPFPLQFEGGYKPEEAARLQLEEYGTDEVGAFRKLRKHYGKLGFGQVPGTPLMVADPYRVMTALAPKRTRSQP